LETKQPSNRRVRPQPLIAVRDVQASGRWFASLLGLTATDGEYGYQRLFSGGELVLQLHAWELENHPNLTNRDSAPAGHGVLLWFDVPDFDAAIARASELQAKVVNGPERNPNSALRELWLRDPNGYVVVLAEPWETGNLGPIEEQELKRQAQRF
jgi:predicted enzyme related to lactoylglutathione lyase